MISKSARFKRDCKGTNYFETYKFFLIFFIDCIHLHKDSEYSPKMQNMQLRQQTLIRILHEEAVYSQEELQAKLRLQGIETTQATLSRDLKALQVTKRPGEGYRLPEQKARPAEREEVLPEITGIDFSGSVAVLHTRPGFAPAVAGILDRRTLFPILGTVAGYDTVLVVIRQGQDPAFVREALASVFPDADLG